MAVRPSQMLELGTQAPYFSLIDARTQQTVQLSELDIEQGLVIMFICNHCPYVKHIREQLVIVANEYQEKGITFMAINSNDITTHPDDAPEKMKEVAEQFNFPFPYLFDESQEVAKSYRAACTPDLYVFDEQRELVYRGQFDNSRPGNGEPVTGTDLKNALDAIIENRELSSVQKPSMGCNIKWKAGNAPEYAS
ncbi:MAG: thioredoxin family protein [Bacteroidota bacterium]